MKAKIVGAGLLILSSSAHALINLGPGQLDLLATASLTYDSNVLGGPTGTSDEYATFAPSLDFTRDAGALKLQTSAGINFIRYFDQTDLNADDLHADLTLRLTEIAGTSLQGSVTAGYTESATIYRELNTRVHTNTFTTGAQGQLSIGRRLTLIGAGSYSTTERASDSSSETVGTNWQLSLADFLRDTSARATYSYSFTHAEAGRFSTVPISQVSHQITTGLSRPLVRYSLTTIYADFGYRFLQRSAAEERLGNPVGDGYVFNAGITGPFLPATRFPKLKSNVSVSYSESATPGLNDDGGRSLQGNIGLDWEARPDTQIGVSASKARSLTINNLTVTTTTFETHVSQRLRYNLTASANAAYLWSDYPASFNPATMTAATAALLPLGVEREDKTFQAGAGLTYSFARVWTSSVRYTYNRTSSTSRLAEFTHHIATISVSCRY